MESKNAGQLAKVIFRIETIFVMDEKPFLKLKTKKNEKMIKALKPVDEELDRNSAIAAKDNQSNKITSPEQLLQSSPGITTKGPLNPLDQHQPPQQLLDQHNTPTTISRQGSHTIANKQVSKNLLTEFEKDETLEPDTKGPISSEQDTQASV